MSTRLDRCIEIAYYRQFPPENGCLIKSGAPPKLQSSTNWNYSSTTAAQHPTTNSHGYAKMKLNCVLIALAAIVVGTDAAINICENVADNVFLTDVTNCSNYYICRNQRPVLESCRENLFFDATIQSCVSNSAVCLVCNPDELTVQALDRTCDKYVLCYGGTPVIQQCYDDLQYNAQLQKCDFPKNVDCVSNKCSIFNDPSNIVYVPSVASCKKYYICMTGVPWGNECVNGLLFNPDCNCCDAASNVDCTVATVKKSAESSASNNTPHIVQMDCPVDGTHFYPHAHSNQYYVCVNGKGAVLSCADGLFYDIKTESCRELQHVLKD